MADSYNLDSIHFELRDMLSRGNRTLAHDYYRNMLAKGIPVQWPGEFGPAPDVGAMAPDESTPRTPAYGFPAAPPAPAPGGAAAAAGQPVPGQPAAPAAPAAPAPPPGLNPVEARNALNYTLSLFPWLAELQLGAQLQDWVVKGLTPDAIVQEIRNTPQHRTRYQGIRRPDGELRMNEAQYNQRKGEYRQLLRRFGRPDYEYDEPSDTAGFFEQEIDPNELKERLETYDNIKRGPSDVRDAFYVYAGIRLTDEDLYAATVNPAAAAKLQADYEARVARSDVTNNYEAWITRVAEVGIERAQRTLGDLTAQGVATGGAVGEVSKLDPNAARLLASALHQGSTGEFLSFNQLLHAFDFALIGGAARFNGLNLPSTERVEALRQAGVNRSKALEGYGTIARESNRWQGMIDRANLGVKFGQGDYEEAVFLNAAPENEILARATSFEKSLSESSGAASFSVDPRTGQVRQRGMRAS